MKAAIYARCSSVKQGEKDLSIPAQIDAARAHALRSGIEIVTEYIDEAESARTADRPEFRRMLAEARAKKRPFDTILVWKFSRFARNREDSVLYKRLLEKHGIRVVSLNEPVDDSPAGKMLEGMLEVIDEFYSANLAADTVRGMRKNAALGFHNGGVTPVGYRVVHTGEGPARRGSFEPDPAFAPLVQRIFREALEGRGMVTIASGLNAEGLLAPGGRSWTKQRVNAVLGNEHYTGARLWGQSRTGRQTHKGADVVRTEGAHEALVSAADFQTVQAALLSRRPAVIHPRRVAGSYLLSGLLVCGQCGKKLIGHKAKSGKIAYYLCPAKSKSGKDACAAQDLNARRTEQAVADELRTKVLTPERLLALVGLTNAELNEKATEAEAEIVVLDERLTDLRRKLSRLYSALEEGTADNATIGPRIKERQAEVREAEARRAEAAARQDAAPRMTVDHDQVARYVEKLGDLLQSGPMGLRRTFLQSWIRRITANGQHLHIEYGFPLWPGGGEGAANDTPTMGGFEEEMGQVVNLPTLNRREPSAMAVGSEWVPPTGVIGSPTWTRTRDTWINSPLLYQLSYRGSPPTAARIVLSTPRTVNEATQVSRASIMDEPYGMGPGSEVFTDALYCLAFAAHRRVYANPPTYEFHRRRHPDRRRDDAHF